MVSILDPSLSRLTKHGSVFTHFEDFELSEIAKHYKAGIILVTQKNQVVVVRNKSSKIWGFPKGSIKQRDKNLSEASSRELMEETGMKILPTIHNSKRIQICRTYYYLICIHCDETVIFDPVDKFEIDEVRLISIPDIHSLENINRDLFKFYNKHKTIAQQQIKQKYTIVQYADGTNSYTNPRF
jgi:8-oxo-dGTP pyrophosphatase MutT (NUDIX family)